MLQFGSVTGSVNGAGNPARQKKDLRFFAYGKLKRISDLD
jgi:hypothetical protein